MLLVRHASAGDSARWEGDDRLRPLDEDGRRRADELATLLGGYEVSHIYSSPAVRCVQTVEPLAHALALEVETRDELGEERQSSDGEELIRSLAGRDVVVCGHGGLEHALPSPRKWRKGAVFVVDGELAIVERL